MLKIDLISKVSKLYLVYLYIVIMGGCCILLWFPDFLVLKLMGLTCCLSYGFYSLKQAHCIKRIQFEPQLGWQIYIKNDLEPAILLGDSTVTRYVSVLRFKVAKRRYSVVFFKYDTLAYVELLRLLMTLRMSGKLNPGKQL